VAGSLSVCSTQSVNMTMDMFLLSGVYTMTHVRRISTPYRCTAYMYHSVKIHRMYVVHVRCVKHAKNNVHVRRSGECKCKTAKGPGSELAREREGQGAKGPGSESSRERIDKGPIGRFAPGSELARERKGSVPRTCTSYMYGVHVRRIP